MTEELDLSGEYFLINNNRLVKGNIKLIICQRQLALNKPKNFMVSVVDGKRKYLSSLYQQNSGDFTFDDYKNRYRLLMIDNNTKAIITKIESKKRRKKDEFRRQVNSQTNSL